MKQVTISIVGTDLMQWGGGIDFLIDFIKIFERHPEKYYCEVLLPKETIPERVVRKILKKEEYYTNLDRITCSLHSECPKVKIVTYVDRRWRKTGRFADIKSIAQRNGTDILMPMTMLMEGVNSKQYVTVSYIYDLQHKHLPELFDADEIKTREEYFPRILDYYDFAFTQSKDTVNDIRTYYGNLADKVYVMYAYPHENQSECATDVVNKYSLSNYYFMVCNQFWMHKNHKVVFDALEILHNRGRKNIMVVCTGDTKDYRNSSYFPSLQRYISNLNCKENIRILGYIDKGEQINLLKGCVSLIQPTLFEGNPGGGAVIDAEAYGIPCIVSDIPVNREIPECYDIVYFTPTDAKSLANQMERALKLYDPTVKYKSKADYEAFYTEYDSVITDMIKRKKKLFSRTRE